MSAAAESLTLEKDTPAKSAEAGVQQTAPASSAFDPFVQRIFGSAPADPPASVADSLSVQRFRAPVLQRAQRLYGNRASQQIVMRAHVVQRQCACGGTCAKCQEEEQQRQAKSTVQPTDRPPVQRGSAAPAPLQFDGLPASTGEHLDPATRRPMEAHFNADLADVRIHTGSEAAKSATSLDALAYTSGRDIYFASGMYAPSSDSGRRLLAHEVAHVVQQSSGKEPTIATKSSHGAKIGAPDDPLESEADRAAEAFMAAPLTDEEERKKREAGVPVQRFIQRQEAPALAATPTLAPGPAPQPGPTPAPQPEAPEQLGPVFGPPRPLPPDAETLEVGDWTFSTDPTQVETELFRVVGERGMGGPYSALWEARSTPGEGSYAGESSAKEKVIQAMEAAIPKVLEKCQAVIDDFERKMRDNVAKLLRENEAETRSEMAKYGITITEVDLGVSPFADPFGGDVASSQTFTEYGMQTQSAKSLGLADAAKILLDRANAINSKKNEQNQHMDVTCTEAGCTSEPDDQYASFTPIIEKMELEYKRARIPLEAQFPVLAPFADEKDNPEGLAILANKDPSNADAKTRLVGEKLKHTLSDIKSVQDAGDDLNVWRLQKIFDITKLQNGTESDPVRNKLVDEKFEQEKPGMWSQILLLALNILGLVLAAPTGGVSLVLTAGVNVAVAAVHVREYLLQNALAGSGLGAAKALSQDVPSLFWLAVEIIGAGMDVGAAAAPFAKLAKLAVAADEAVKGTEEGTKAIEALEAAAKNEPHGAELVAGIERHFGGASKETEALEAFGVSAEESKDLVATTKAADEAAKAAETSAVGTETLAGGQVKATNAGLFSCASPCTMIRQKFSAELVLRDDLNKQLLELEAELAAKQGDKVAMKAIEEKAAAIEKQLRQTVTFKPDALGKPGFEDLLKRRGSGTEKLLNKPKDWIGADEAAFKWGDKAVLKGETAEKYYWRLNPDGELSLVAKDAKFPKLKFDPAEGKFIEVEEGTAFRAEYEDVVPEGTEEGVYSKTKLKPKEREEFDKILKERDELFARRKELQDLDAAGKLTEEQEKELSKVLGQITSKGEEVGNKAAQHYVESLGARPVAAGKPGQSGVFDQIWEKTAQVDGKTVKQYYVVEAKGGGARLGTRQVAGGAAEQGTPQYFRSILDKMADGELKTNLELALKDGKVTYLKVQAPIGAEGGQAVLADFKVAVFNIATNK
jgi:hypothetical protein